MARFDQILYFEGKKLTYYQYFALMGSTQTLIISFSFFILYLILRLMDNYQKDKKILGWLNNKSQLIQKLKLLSYYTGFMFLSWVPMICQALDVIGLIEGIIGQAIILIISVFLKKQSNSQHQKKQQIIYNATPQINQQIDSILDEQIKQFICAKISSQMKKIITKCFFFSIFINLITYKTCLSMYNTETLFYSNFFGYDINTYLTRYLTVKQSCPVGGPCQMYTTIPENPSEAVFLNLHTHVSVKSVDVYYQELLTPNVTDFKKVTADFFPYEGLERLARRNVHSALISGLKPNTKYLTKVFYDNRFWTNAIFKTLPAPGNKKTPIRMINAGDFGYNQIAINMSKIVSQLKPDIFFIGGDLSYDDNMPACAYTWDQFFAMYGRITTELEYLMPMVAGVGNHDVGINQFSGRNVTVDNYGPAFHIYLPQHYENHFDQESIQKVPEIQKRRMFLNFTFGNVHYIILDSGYMHGFDGYQKNFMNDSFQANKDKIKFVNYHVPMFSVCKGIDRDPTRLLTQITNWVPIFDKYHVMTSFENHVHSFKRTRPLVYEQPSQYGTVYLGDGGYSAFIQPMWGPEPDDHTFEAYANKNNFWLTQITQHKVEHWAYDNYGQIIDHLIQYPQNYTIGTKRRKFKLQQLLSQKLQNYLQFDQQSYQPKQGIIRLSQKLPYLKRLEIQEKNKKDKIQTNKETFKHQFSNKNSIKRRENFHDLIQSLKK